MNKYAPVIGLEIHVELYTISKMFCQCAAEYFELEPNSNTCPVCLGMPGALPVPNRKAIEWTILIGLALNCKINKVSKFDRKHYFYADLPKGYQISQYDEPVAENGHLEINGKKFRIRRVHLEEDTGKLIHEGKESLVDFNRSGVPLVEIVTEPDFDNSEDAKRFLEELHIIIKEYLHVSEANMERGDMRLEPNISVREISTDKSHDVNNFQLPKYKVEVKNINSFRFAQKAIEYEIKRQAEILDKDETPAQETRGWDENHNKTVAQRTKEEAHDYRYFPEPDIPPLEFSNDYIEQLRSQLPEMPVDKQKRYEKMGVKTQDALIIARSKKTIEYFEETIEKLNKLKPQQIANVIVNKKIKIGAPVDDIETLLTPKKTDMKMLETTINQAIDVNKKAVDDFKAGKKNSIIFLVGQVMRKMKGKADVNKVKELLIAKLSNG